MKNRNYIYLTCLIILIGTAGYVKNKNDDNVEVERQENLVTPQNNKGKKSTPVFLVDSKQDLDNNKGNRIRITAIYYSPGKGHKYLNCKYAKLRIADYSFYKKDDFGKTISPMIAMIQNGDKVEVEADLKYYTGSKSLVETHPVRQEALPPKEIIDGKEYYIFPPNYYIMNGELVR
ncbi:MAG: hypothetical protein D3910_20775, partial [Candidatus Electrothrix sp. ATG2]|nr:hypothetical protein [Candidatus Electrothrix sp. ATG2]